MRVRKIFKVLDCYEDLMCKVHQNNYSGNGQNVSFYNYYQGRVNFSHSPILLIYVYHNFPLSEYLVLFLL